MKKRTLGGIVLALLLSVGTFVVRSWPRPIPPEIVARSVIQDPVLLAKAEELPAARELLSELRYQSNISVCGPASLANVLRVLGEEATTEQAVLDGSGRCLLGFCVGGLTLEDLAEVARLHTTRKVTVLQDLSPEQFKAELIAANQGKARYIINFHRKPIFTMGGGHHSPIGGYLEAEDLVFVLDVNEDYKPWLVSRETLYAAMNTIDGQKKRGMLRFD